MTPALPLSRLRVLCYTPRYLPLFGGAEYGIRELYFRSAPHLNATLLSQSDILGLSLSSTENNTNQLALTGQKDKHNLRKGILTSGKMPTQFFNASFPGQGPNNNRIVVFVLQRMQPLAIISGTQLKTNGLSVPPRICSNIARRKSAFLKQTSQPLRRPSSTIHRTGMNLEQKRHRQQTIPSWTQHRIYVFRCPIWKSQVFKNLLCKNDVVTAPFRWRQRRADIELWIPSLREAFPRLGHTSLPCKPRDFERIHLICWKSVYPFLRPTVHHHSC